MITMPNGKQKAKALQAAKDKETSDAADAQEATRKAKVQASLKPIDPLEITLLNEEILGHEDIVQEHKAIISRLKAEATGLRERRKDLMSQLKAQKAKKE